MELDFKPEEWLRILSANPVLLVMLGALVIGSSFTQIIKKTWIAFGETSAIPIERYRVSCMWLAILSTYGATHVLWRSIIGGHGHGLEHAVALGASVPCPFLYKLVKALVRWKFPKLAEAMGDEGKVGP